MRKKKALAKICVIYLLVFAVLGIGLELFLRQTVTSIRSVESGSWLEANPELLIRYTGNGRRLVPDTSVIIKNHYISDTDALVETNGYGFRAAPIPKQKAADEIRILALGDSITIAEYLPLEQTLTHLVELDLERTLPGKDISVINAGVMDIGLREQRMILEEVGLSTKPDIVLVNFYLNDSRPSWGFANETRHRGWIRRHSVMVELIHSQLQLRRWIQQQGTDRFAWVSSQETLDWKQSRADFEQLVSDAAYDWGAAWQTESWRSLEPEFARLQELAEQHSFTVVLAALPVKFQVFSEVADTKPQEKLQKIAEEYDFTFVDLLPPLQRAAQSLTESELFYDQCHPTAAGFRILAGTLAPRVQRLIKK